MATQTVKKFNKSVASNILVAHEEAAMRVRDAVDRVIDREDMATADSRSNWDDVLRAYEEVAASTGRFRDDSLQDHARVMAMAPSVATTGHRNGWLNERFSSMAKFYKAAAADPHGLGQDVHLVEGWLKALPAIEAMFMAPDHGVDIPPTYFDDYWLAYDALMNAEPDTAEGRAIRALYISREEDDDKEGFFNTGFLSYAPFSTKEDPSDCDFGELASIYRAAMIESGRQDEPRMIAFTFDPKAWLEQYEALGGKVTHFTFHGNVPTYGFDILSMTGDEDVVAAAKMERELECCSWKAHAVGLLASDRLFAAKKDPLFTEPATCKLSHPVCLIRAGDLSNTKYASLKQGLAVLRAIQEHQKRFNKVA